MFVWGPQKRGILAFLSQKDMAFWQRWVQINLLFGWSQINQLVFFILCIFFERINWTHIFPWPNRIPYIQCFNLKKILIQEMAKNLGGKWIKVLSNLLLTQTLKSFSRKIFVKLISRKNKPRIWTWFQPFLLPCRLLESSQVEQE